MTSTSYHIATRVLANLGGRQAPEGDKLVKAPRGHVITGLLQFEHLLCRIIAFLTLNNSAVFVHCVMA